MHRCERKDKRSENKLITPATGIRLLQDNSGVAAIEAGLLFPVLAALLMGTVQFSLILYTNSAIQTAAREVTRQLAVNVLTTTAVQDAVHSRIPSWAAGSEVVSVSQTNPADPTSNYMTVSVNVPSSKASPLSFLTMGDWKLSATVTMKQEDKLP